MVASVNTSALGCALIAPVTCSTGSNAKLLSCSAETCTEPDASPLYKCRVYGRGTSYLLCHRFSFQNMSFCSGNLRMCDLYRASNMKTTLFDP